MTHKQTLTWNMAGNTQKRGKLEMHTVGPGISLSKLKIMEMTNMHCRRCNMARNSEQGENEKCTLQDLEYGEKSVNDGK